MECTDLTTAEKSTEFRVQTSPPPKKISCFQREKLHMNCWETRGRKHNIYRTFFPCGPLKCSTWEDGSSKVVCHLAPPSYLTDGSMGHIFSSPRNTAVPRLGKWFFWYYVVSTLLRNITLGLFGKRGEAVEHEEGKGMREKEEG